MRCFTITTTITYTVLERWTVNGVLSKYDEDQPRKKISKQSWVHITHRHYTIKILCCWLGFSPVKFFVQGWIVLRLECVHEYLLVWMSVFLCVYVVCRGKDEDHHKGLQLCSERNALTFVVTRPSFLCPETWRRLFSSASTPIARDHYPLTDLTLFRSKAYNKKACWWSGMMVVEMLM